MKNHTIIRANTKLLILKSGITYDIQKHRQNLWKEHLDAHWDHIHNTQIIWKTIHGLSKKAPPPTLNTYIPFNNEIATTLKHIANCFTKQFINTVNHVTQKPNRSINKATHKLQGYNITTTHTYVQYLDFTHRKISTYLPRANSECERFMRI